MQTTAQLLVLHRLGKQQWFTLCEAAYASGWSRQYLSDACSAGKLPAQHTRGSGLRRRTGTTRQNKIPSYWRIHRDDLALWITKQANFCPNQSIQNVSQIASKWPPSMRKCLAEALFATLPNT